MTTINKNDFVEIEFTGKANNEVFDTTDKEVAKKMGLEYDVTPLIISVGNQMLLKSFDDFLEGKEIGKKYSLKLTPEKAFGKRNPSMIKTMPIKVFHEKEINPYPGMAVQLDNYIAKVLSVSGGRVSVDFNNPLAGKDIEYDFTIKRKVEDDTERVNALQEFFFKQKFEFVIKGEGKDKKVIFKKPEIKPFVDIFKPKFNAMTGLDFDVEEKSEKKEVKEEKKE
ncbi:Putative FKBP-type peptidyl-prolyl cis-trans isomerase [uncultured archaeon]|nr:Putative FKBP-type peptidyl-prolyl cis-trans isomerase [uncultured archaeon]